MTTVQLSILEQIDALERVLSQHRQAVAAGKLTPIGAARLLVKIGDARRELEQVAELLPVAEHA
jgi:hypothetical protein